MNEKREPKYLTTKELLAKLNRIEEIAEKLDDLIKKNDLAHEEFEDEFRELAKFYKRYSAAKNRFDGE